MGRCRSHRTLDRLSHDRRPKCTERKLRFHEPLHGLALHTKRRRLQVQRCRYGHRRLALLRDHGRTLRQRMLLCLRGPTDEQDFRSAERGTGRPFLFRFTEIQHSLRKHQGRIPTQVSQFRRPAQHIHASLLPDGLEVRPVTRNRHRESPRSAAQKNHRQRLQTEHRIPRHEHPKPDTQRGRHG